MADRAAAMDSSFPSTAWRPSLLRRLILLFLFTAGVVFWLTLLYQAKPDFPFLLILILSVSAIGLACGLGARLALSERHAFIRFLAALASLMIGLYVLGYLTNWKMGLGPLEFWRDEIDYFEAAQLGGGALAALMALSAWRRPVRLVEQSSRSRLAPRAAARQASASSSHSPVAPSPRSGLRTPGAWARKPGPAAPGRLPVRAKPAQQDRVAQRFTRPVEKLIVGRPPARTPVRPKRSRSRRKGLFQRRREVQLSMYEEHKCPYCLEDVKRNDPRGVKQCSVCHTLHHADCWAVTGMCQVPHINT